MFKVLSFGFILASFSFQSFVFGPVSEAKPPVYTGQVETRIDKETGEEAVVIPTTIALPQFSANITEFIGPEFYVENGAEDTLIFRGILKPGILYDFGLNVKVGYNRASAKKGLAYEEDLLFHPRPNGKFEIEVPFTPLYDLSQVFVVAEIYFQDQLLTRQSFQTGKLSKRPKEEPKPTHEEETETTKETETQPSKPETDTKTPDPSAQKDKDGIDISTPTPEVEEVLPDAPPPSDSFLDRIFRPKTGNPLVDHWPIFSAIGVIVLIILIGAIRSGLKKRHLNILLLVIGIGSSVYLAMARNEADSGGTWTLPQPYGLTYYSLDGSHPLSVLPIQFQGTYSYTEPVGGSTVTDDFDADTVEQLGLRVFKEESACTPEQQPCNNINFEDTGYINPTEIEPNVYRYTNGSGNTIDVTFGPDPGEFSFGYPLERFTQGIYSGKSFDDGLWTFEVRVRFDTTHPDVNKKTVYIPYQLAGTNQYIGIDSVSPTFDLRYFHDTTEDDTYVTQLDENDVSDPSTQVPTPTGRPIKLEVECLDRSTFNPARNGNANPPYIDFEASGCMDDAGLSTGFDPVVREVFIKGNFCDDPVRCDTLGHRKFRTCDGSANCNDTEVIIDWYDPIPPQFRSPFPVNTDPTYDRITYDEVGEEPVGIRFLRVHPDDADPSNDAITTNKTIKISGKESTVASLAAGNGMYMQFFLDDQDHHIDSDGLCYGINCPTGFDPVADASSTNLYDNDACGYESDGTRLDNLFINESEGVCDEQHRACINEQGFVGELNENPVGRECIPNCPIGYTLNGTVCDS